VLLNGDIFKHPKILKNSRNGLGMGDNQNRVILMVKFQSIHQSGDIGFWQGIGLKTESAGDNSAGFLSSQRI